MSSYSHMKPPPMPAELFQLAILFCTLLGVSPELQPEPWRHQSPGSTFMPRALFQEEGTFPAPPS
jgi:hypothetical protein